MVVSVESASGVTTPGFFVRTGTGSETIPGLPPFSEAFFRTVIGYSVSGVKPVNSALSCHVLPPSLLYS